MGFDAITRTTRRVFIEQSKLNATPTSFKPDWSNLPKAKFVKHLSRGWLIGFCGELPQDRVVKVYGKGHWQVMRLSTEPIDVIDGLSLYSFTKLGVPSSKVKPRELSRSDV